MGCSGSSLRMASHRCREPSSVFGGKNSKEKDVAPESMRWRTDDRTADMDRSLGAELKSPTSRAWPPHPDAGMPTVSGARRFEPMPETTMEIDTTLRRLRADFSDIVAQFVRGQVDLLTGISPDLLPLLDTLEDLLDGGKKLRPTFAYWGWRSAGGSESGPILTASAALEFLQACALIHDDVMDGSDTRRGKPAAHRRLASMHRSPRVPRVVGGLRSGFGHPARRPVSELVGRVAHGQRARTGRPGSRQAHF